MTKDEIKALIDSIFMEQFELEQADLAPEKEIFADLGLDSLDVVDLVIGLQRKFGIPLKQNEEIRKIVTVGNVYDFFIKLAAENPEFAAGIAARS